MVYLHDRTDFDDPTRYEPPPVSLDSELDGFPPELTRYANRRCWCDVPTALIGGVCLGVVALLAVAGTIWGALSGLGVIG